MQTEGYSLDRVLAQRTKEARDLRAALDEHAIVAITNAEGRIIFVNDNFCNISGYSQEELTGQDYRIMNSSHHPKEFIHDLWQTITSGKVWRGDICNRTKDGAFYWVATTVVPFLNEEGMPRHYVAIQADITKQKALETELEGKLRLETLLANLSTRFAGLTSDQIDEAIEKAQQLIVETLGIDRSTIWQFTGNPPGMALTHYWQGPGWPALPVIENAEAKLPWAFAKVTNSEDFSFSSLDELPPEAAVDVRLMREHGPKSNVTIPLIVNGEPFGAIAFGMLRRERNWTEKEIADLKLVAQIIANVMGRRKAEVRSEQLRAEIARSVRSAMLGELSAALAHELNQPLTAILNNAQAGQRFLGGAPSEPGEIESILDDIVRDCRRAGSVIHNLRKMLGKTTEEREACSVGDVIGEVAGFMHGELVRRKVVLASQPLEHLPQVRAARVELQQIIMNLLVNAAQSMEGNPPGARRIEIRAYRENGSVVVIVRDHGAGIPPENLPRIFDPFYTTKPTGLGMGLPICRRFVESHGGRIEARNHEEQGAVFSFSLPVMAAAG